jgi:Tetracyclin repressor-like, C-terminal domain
LGTVGPYSVADRVPLQGSVGCGDRIRFSPNGAAAYGTREGDLAVKLLTTKASEFQQRLIQLIAEVVDADRRNGHLHSAVPADDLPYVLVRIMESYVYLSLITGDEPDTARAASVIHALLPAR